MKQFTIIVETIIKEDSPVFLVRDPRTGNVVRVLSSTDELATFFDEAIVKLQTPVTNE